MTHKRVTDELRRIHYTVDVDAQVIDCFRVEVWDICIYAADSGVSWGRPALELKQLWAEALRIAKFLQDSFARRDYRQFGLRNRGDLQPFAYITGCWQERERAKYQVGFDTMIYEGMWDRAQRGQADPKDHDTRVRLLDDVVDGLEWLEMN